MEHYYLSYCESIQSVIPLLYLLSAIWVLVTIAWWYLTFVKFKEHSYNIQKTLLLFPLCKVMETLINGMYIDQCPWISMGGKMTDKYI